EKRVYFREELRDFFRFLRKPTFSRYPVEREAANSVFADWFGGLDVGRVLMWALFLWGINLAVFGPLAAMAAGAAGAEHRLNLQNIPWLQALIWAPIVEELVFRFGLRRPLLLFWVVPVAAVSMVSGTVWYSVSLVAIVSLLLIQPAFNRRKAIAHTKQGGAGDEQSVVGRVVQQVLGKQRVPHGVLRIYRQHFVWVLYMSTLAFAALHLYNFVFTRMPLWLLPLMVTPQFVTGLVLAWMRVRRGIGAAILLHGMFNGGPLLLVWLIIQFMPEMAA